MDVDQIVPRTREVAVELAREYFRVGLSPAAAALLEGVEEYAVPRAASGEELRELDASLAAILEGGLRGHSVSLLDLGAAGAVPPDPSPP
jgi:hypothetical protein